MICTFLIVGLGGALGSMLRYGITILTTLWTWSPLWGTLSVNILGSALIGFLTSFCVSNSWMLFLSMGLCGGFTTFSTFSSQNIALLNSGRFGLSIVYQFTTLLLCLLATYAGWKLGIKN